MAAKSTRSAPVKEWPEVRVIRGVMRANAAIREHMRRYLEPHGLGLIEFDFLAALGNTGGLRMRDLAHGMITTPSNVTRVCAEMEKRGLAVRERSPQSDREVIARLSPAGHKLFEKIFLETATHSALMISEAIPAPDDQRRVAALLEQLLAGLDRHGA